MTNAATTESPAPQPTAFMTLSDGTSQMIMYGNGRDDLVCPFDRVTLGYTFKASTGYGIQSFQICDNSKSTDPSACDTGYDLPTSPNMVAEMLPLQALHSRFQ